MPASNGEHRAMIKTFRHRGLKELFETGRTRHVPTDLMKRVRTRLDLINQAKNFNDLDQPGWKLHYLTPTTRLSIWVNGAWRITLDLRGGDAFDLDLEQYH
jgi:proteic killer suppression protein